LRFAGRIDPMSGVPRFCGETELKGTLTYLF